MRYYESLYIVNPNYEQNRLDEVMKTVSDKIGEYGFSIINHRAWSKKRLAYAIQKHKYGTFVLIHFETESVENLNNFERFMVLQKPVLRNQTVVLDARPEVHIEEEPAVPENAEADKKTEAPKAKVEKTEEIVMKPVVEKKEKSSEASEEEPAVDQPLDEEASAVVKKSAGEEDSTVESEEAVIEPGKTEEVQE